MIIEDWLGKAIRLADDNPVEIGASFGAIIVKDGCIIGQGVNEVRSTNDPTKHAEIEAIRKACKHLNTTNLSGCELYASTHPCAMCLSAIYLTNIQTVYYANPSNKNQDYVYEQLSVAHDEKSILLKRIDIQ